MSRFTANSRIVGAAVLLLVALTAVYWNHFDNSFHFDDSHTIVNNSYITDIRNLPLVFKDARTGSSLPTNQAYRPVVTSLNAFDYWIAGELDPKVFHWHIFLEFLLLLVLLYQVSLKIFYAATSERHPWMALFCCAFFAFHTATAETINYIIARSDGFSTLMVLAGFALYVGNTGWKKQWGLVPFIIGSLAKPTTLMLAPLLLVFELLIVAPAPLISSERTSFAAKLRGSLAGTASYFVIGVVMYFFTRSMFAATWTPSNVSTLHYLNTQPFIVWIYLKTFFVPTGLTADTDLGLIKDLLSPKVLWGLLVIVVLLSITWLSLRKRETLPIGFGILWFFIALAPSSSFVPLAEVMNHHRTFFPYIGLVVSCSWAAYLLYRKVNIAPSRKSIAVSVLALVFLAAHAWGTWQRNETWDNDESLWLDVTLKSPGNGRGLMNYGLQLMREGQLEESIEYYERALDTSYGRHPYLYINLGNATQALAKQGHDAELGAQAENYLKQAVQLGPGYPQTHFYYASWLSNNGRPVEALGHVDKTLQLAPAHQQAQRLRQKVLLAAEADLGKALQITSQLNTPEAWLEMSLKYYNAGQFQQSVDASMSALALRPDYAAAYNNICAANNSLGRFAQAIKACERSLDISPDYALAKGNLDWARSQQQKQ